MQYEPSIAVLTLGVLQTPSSDTGSAAVFHLITFLPLAQNTEAIL